VDAPGNDGKASMPEQVKRPNPWKKMNNNNNNNNNNNSNVAIFEDRNEIKKAAEKILKYKELTYRNSAHVECENKSDNGNNGDDWNHFKVIQTIPEIHTGKARN